MVNLPNSPDSMKRLAICVIVVLCVLVLVGVLLWPYYQDQRWQENASRVREGMAISEVIRQLGPDFRKEEFADIGGGNPEDRYTWQRGGTTLTVVVKNDTVMSVQYFHRAL
jgi:hypothetical protein